MKFRTGLLLFAVLACASCAHHPNIQYVDRVVEVDKPVAVQPIKSTDVPAVPAPLGPRPATVPQQKAALLSKVCEFVAYALQADPLLRVSAGLPQQALPDFPECDKH